MASSAIMKIFLCLGLAELGLCQAPKTYTHLKDQPADPRSPLLQPPKLGMGTWFLDHSVKNTSDAVAGAIAQGYRHIDTAAIYLNHKGVGQGIKEGIKRANIKRSDIWLTTKLWSDMHGNPTNGIKKALSELGLDYIDLYLMHFPMGALGGFDHVQTWKAMEKLVQPSGNGPARYIGVANLGPKLLDELLTAATIKPLVHQFEVHPYLQQRDWVKRNKELNMTVIAYAPLGNTSPTYRTHPMYSNKQASGDLPMLLQHETIKKIGARRNCTGSQVVLAWNLRLGQTVIPKSEKLARQKENWGATDCKLTDEDDKDIAAIETKYGPRRLLNVCAIFRKNCYEGLTGLDRWKSWGSILPAGVGIKF